MRGFPWSIPFLENPVHELQVRIPVKRGNRENIELQKLVIIIQLDKTSRHLSR